MVFFLFVERCVRRRSAGAERVFHRSKPRSIRGGRLLILHLQLIHNLLDVRNGSRDSGDLRAQGLRVHLARQRDHAALDSELDVFLEMVLNESGIQVLFDALIQIGVHLFRVAFGACRHNGNFIRDNLRSGERLRDGFRLRLVPIGGDVPAKRYDSYVAILMHGYIFQIGVVERAAQGFGDVDRFGRRRGATAQGTGGEECT